MFLLFSCEKKPGERLHCCYFIEFKLSKYNLNSSWNNNFISKIFTQSVSHLFLFGDKLIHVFCFVNFPTYLMALLSVVFTLLLILEFRLAHCFDDAVTLRNERFFLLHKSSLCSYPTNEPVIDMMMKIICCLFPVFNAQ